MDKDGDGAVSVEEFVAFAEGQVTLNPKGT
jgi:hypothetical protein